MVFHPNQLLPGFEGNPRMKSRGPSKQGASKAMNKVGNDNSFYILLHLVICHHGLHVLCSALYAIVHASRLRLSLMCLSRPRKTIEIIDCKFFRGRSEGSLQDVSFTKTPECL